MKNIPANKYLILNIAECTGQDIDNKRSLRKAVYDRGDCYAERASSSVGSTLQKRVRIKNNAPLINWSSLTKVALLFITLTVPQAYSQSTNLLTLEDALAVAAVHNLSIQQAENVVQISANSASYGNAGLLPRLDLSSGTSIIDATIQTAGGEVSAQTTRNTAGINAGYALFRGMQGLNTYKLLNTQAAASELLLDLTTENILFATSQAYFNLLITHDNLSILTEQVSVSRERLEQALDKNDLGMSSRLQALAARVDFDSDSSSVLEAEFAYSEAHRRLNLLLGWEIDRRYDPVQINREFGLYDAGELEEQVLQGNRSLLISQNQEAQSQIKVKNSKSSLMPSLNFSGSYGLQQVNPDVDLGLGDSDKTLSAGLTLSWNLFDGRKGKNIQNAKIQQKNSELSTLDSKRQTLSDLKSAHNSFIKSQQILALKQNNLASAQLNFEQTNEYFRLGVVSSTQFRESQLNLSRVKISLIQAKYSAYLDELKIWQLTGQLEERMLLGNS